VYRSLILLAGIAAAAALLPAQNAMISENKQNYETIKKNILLSADRMPDDAYSFRATKEERTWAELMGHIADAQMFICSAAAGEGHSGNAGKLTGKTELIKALKDSFAACDAVWESTTDANAHNPAKLRNRDFTRLGMLIYNTTHDNESYGTMAVYLRLKGVVPPSSVK
jgi:uncharacterized damage-inducible protein DinB